MTAVPALLAVDWGTTALRGALLAADGTVIATHAAPRGLLSVPPGGWQAAFDAEFGPWLAAHPGLPCLMSGMVGSRQGWAEAPYVACPAGLAEVAHGLLWLQPGRLAIVPGLSAEADGIPDVLRGEEVQAFGALMATADAGDDHTLVLPGTHSKWLRVQGDRITGFATHMTGEVYALLRQQSILARMLPADDDAFDADAFDAGVAQAAMPGGLLHHLFAIRTLALLDRASGAALASRLSGLLIGEELRAQVVRLQAGAPVSVIASPALALRYQRALRSRGHAVRLAPTDAGWLGVLAVARAAGLVAAPGTLPA